MCGYSLQGLGDAGRCPECGEPFGPDRLVLWGITTDKRFKGARNPIIRRLLFAWTMLWVLAAIAFVAWSPTRDWFMLLFLPVIAVLSVWNLWQAGKPHQIHLRADGFAFRVGFGKVRYRAWTKDDEVDLRRVSEGRYAFVIRRLLRTMGAVEVQCDDASAENLRNRVQTMIDRRVGLEK